MIDIAVVKAIVFDLDDTLYPQVDFKISGFKAVAKWLEIQTNIPCSRTIDILLELLHTYGPSYPYFFDDCASQLNLIPAWIARMVDVFRSHSPKINLFPDVFALLGRLKSHCRLGILTDGLWTVQQRKVMSLRLQNVMDAVLYSDRLNTQKPDTILYRWFETRFKLSGWQLLYVGDNPIKDFSGAKECGWQTLRVRTGEHAALIAPECADADYTVDQVGDLATLFRDTLK